MVESLGATSTTDHLAAGRDALARGAWEQARAAYDAALARDASAVAWEGRSWAAWWLDDVSACLDARERAYRLYRASDDRRGAARVALWLGDDHLEFRGEPAVANGWFGRAARLLEGVDTAPEHGWLHVFRAHLALGANDLREARRLGGLGRELGARLGDVDLEMFALATEGLALVNEGAVADGMRRLDEAAAAALGGEFDHLVPAGWTCCYLLYACENVRDYDRAAQWCRKVDEFSARLRIRFVNGTCRSHYAVVLSWHGDDAGAERELLRALDDLTATRPFWRSEAIVRLGEVRRRQGRLAEAEALFEQAPRHSLSRLGLAELALDRGEPAAARDLLERVLRDVPAANATKRAAPVELMARALAALGEVDEAAALVAELDAIAATVATLAVRAGARFATGVVAAAGGDRDDACRCLADAAELFAAGGGAFEEARARATLERVRGARAAPLTARQLEVLRLVADGLGDRAIAERLCLSEHTVHRHLQNAFARLGCRSRAAAVASAGRLGLL